jgi:hypothetical protein
MEYLPNSIEKYKLADNHERRDYADIKEESK